MGIDYLAGVVLSSAPDLTYFFELKNGATTGYYAGGKYITQIAEARRNAWKGRMQPAFEKRGRTGLNVTQTDGGVIGKAMTHQS
jgi:hypothetical protein